MKCPKCNGEGRSAASFKDGDTSYRRIRCKSCGAIYFAKVEETACDSEEFYTVQRKYENDKYRRECMRRYQTSLRKEDGKNGSI